MQQRVATCHRAVDPSFGWARHGVGPDSVLQQDALVGRVSDGCVRGGGSWVSLCNFGQGVGVLGAPGRPPKDVALIGLIELGFRQTSGPRAIFDAAEPESVVLGGSGCRCSPKSPRLIWAAFPPADLGIIFPPPPSTV